MKFLYSDFWPHNLSVLSYLVPVQGDLSYHPTGYQLSCNVRFLFYFLFELFLASMAIYLPISQDVGMVVQQRNSCRLTPVSVLTVLN